MNPVVDQLGGADRLEAAVGQPLEAGRPLAPPREPRERQPRRLGDVGAAAPETLALAGEADQRERGAGRVAPGQGAALDLELADEDVGDPLPAGPRVLAGGERVEYGADRRQVDDRVVPLLLDLAEGPPEAFADGSRPARTPPPLLRRHPVLTLGAGTRSEHRSRAAP
jgi:hypothetical protein